MHLHLMVQTTKARHEMIPFLADFQCFYELVKFDSSQQPYPTLLLSDSHASKKPKTRQGHDPRAYYYSPNWQLLRGPPCPYRATLVHALQASTAVLKL